MTNFSDTRSARPVGSNADEWHLFLSQYLDNRAAFPTGLTYVAVQIAEAIDAAELGDKRISADGRRVAFIKERYGAVVASIQEDGDGAVEVQALDNGKFVLTIHSRVGDTDRFDDLSATLEPKHFELLGSIARIPPSGTTASSPADGNST